MSSSLGRRRNSGNILTGGSSRDSVSSTYRRRSVISESRPCFFSFSGCLQLGTGWGQGCSTILFPSAGEIQQLSKRRNNKTFIDCCRVSCTVRQRQTLCVCVGKFAGPGERMGSRLVGGGLEQLLWSHVGSHR